MKYLTNYETNYEIHIDSERIILKSMPKTAHI